MTTECNAREFDFQGLGNRAVTARFDGAAGSVKQLAKIVERVRLAWPKMRIIVRGDSGFCRENLVPEHCMKTFTVATVWPARHGNGNGALRHDSVEAVETWGVGVDDAIPAGRKRPVIPTSGCRRRSPVADFVLPGRHRARRPACRAVRRSKAAVWCEMRASTSKTSSQAA
jgi:hypothetical protein